MALISSAVDGISTSDVNLATGAVDHYLPDQTDEAPRPRQAKIAGFRGWGQ